MFCNVLAVIIGFLVMDQAACVRSRCWPLYFKSANPLLRCASHGKESDIETMRKSLKYDEALLRFDNKLMGKTLQVFAQSDDCYNCPCLNATRLSASENITCKVDVAFPLQFLVTKASNSSNEICRYTIILQSH